MGRGCGHGLFPFEDLPHPERGVESGGVDLSLASCFFSSATSYVVMGPGQRESLVNMETSGQKSYKRRVVALELTTERRYRIATRVT